MSDKWFDSSYYATQKVAQLNAITYPEGAAWLAAQTGAPTTWTVDLYNAYLAQYTLNGAPVTAMDNFNACNAVSYAGNTGVTLADINVSPNQYFVVTEYLQALANYDAANGNSAATVQSELSTIFNTDHTSVWSHYNQNWATTLINPSNMFDTQAYLQARAQAMAAETGNTGVTVQDAIAAIQQLGINPVQDWYDYGQDHNIEAPAVDAPITPVVPDGWTQWSTSSGGDTPTNPDAPTDPYDQNTTPVAMTFDQTEYTGENGQNTVFQAQFPAGGVDATLNPDDVITADASAYNTLEIALGANWSGFNTQTDENGEATPSVSGVGRLVLNHGAPYETPLTFNAQNISGLQRVDVNNVANIGNGTISLSNLAATANTINLAGPQTTGEVNLAWTGGAPAGGTLNLGLDGVGKASDPTQVIAANGISTLDLNLTNTNNVDLTALSNFKTLKVEGDGNVFVSGTPNSVTAVDASTATGTHNIGLGLVTNRTSIAGGTGFDEITLNANTALSNPTWTGIEAIAAAGDVTSINIKAANIQGLQQLDVFNITGTDTLSQVTATDFTINGCAGTTKNPNNTATSVTGTIENLTYNTASVNWAKNLDYSTAKLTSGNSADPLVTSDVTKNVDININNSGSADDAFVGTFNVKQATGDVTVDVARAVQSGTTTYTSKWGGEMNAQQAQTFTAHIDGELQDGTIFNTVTAARGQDAQIGRTFYLAALNVAQPVADDWSTASLMNLNEASAPAVRTTINANGAWDATIDVVGGMSLTKDSNLTGARNIDITLANAAKSATANWQNVFDATHLPTLVNVNQLNVEAGGETVLFGNIGLARTRSGNINIDIQDAENNGASQMTSLTGADKAAVILGQINTSTGGSIDLNIAAAKGDVFIDDITARTVENTQTEGDVNITVGATGKIGGGTLDVKSSTYTFTADTAVITGDELYLNFENVEQGAFTDNGLTLNAQGAINYVGSELGGDGASGKEIAVASVGNGSSNFTLNGSDDFLTFNEKSINSGATIAVDMGAGDDTLTVKANALNAATTMTIYCGIGKDTITLEAQNAKTPLTAIIEDFNQTEGDSIGTFDAKALATVDNVSTLLSKFGIQLSTTAINTLVGTGDISYVTASDGTAVTGDTAVQTATGVVYNGNLYASDGATADAATTYVEVVGLIDGQGIAAA